MIGSSSTGSKSRCFFRKERATSADPASRSKRKSAHEPFYANLYSLINSHHHSHNNQGIKHVNNRDSVQDGINRLIISSTPEPRHSLDADYLMKNIEHNYRANSHKPSMGLSRMKESKSMINFPRSSETKTMNYTSDDRTSSTPLHHRHNSQDNGISTKNRIKKFILQTTGQTSKSSFGSSKKPSMLVNNNNGRNSALGRMTNTNSAVSNSSSFWHLTSSKPISLSLLDYVSSQIKTEGIDLTEQPYSDAVCSISSPSP